MRENTDRGRGRSSDGLKIDRATWGKSREHIAIPCWEGRRHGGPRAREESLTTRGGLDQEAGQEIGVAKVTKYYYRDQRTEDLGRGGGGCPSPIPVSGLESSG